MVTVPATVEPQKSPGGIDLSVIKACLAVSINAMPRPAALVDAAGQIVATNLAFRSEIDAVSAELPGTSPDEACLRTTPALISIQELAQAAASGTATRELFVGRPGEPGHAALAAAFTLPTGTAPHQLTLVGTANGACSPTQGPGQSPVTRRGGA